MAEGQRVNVACPHCKHIVMGHNAKRHELGMAITYHCGHGRCECAVNADWTVATREAANGA